MPHAHARYDHRYPRQGQVALLCEGDVAGFEVDLLEKWTIQRTGLLVDVWPCGTKGSFFGVSDAIGRSRPIAVIEDRDFRELEGASDTCKKLANDRRRRAVTVKIWTTWQRNEIENYVIEPDVLVPVLAKQFDVAENGVRDRLHQVISAMGVDQAAQYAIHQFRCLLSDRHPARYIVGLPRKTHRPLVDPGRNAITVPPLDAVHEKLTEEFSSRKDSLFKDQSGLDAKITQLLDEFRAVADKWGKATLLDQAWRMDWAGKDVLSLVCRWLAAERGWFDSNGCRIPVDWDALGSEDGATLEREIFAQLQPDLVAGLLSFLERNPQTTIGQEWNTLASQLA